MSNPARRKGTRAELKAVEVFATQFRFCERRVQRGRNDAGDLAGLPIPVEVKSGPAYLSEAMAESKAAAARLGVKGYAVYIPARGKAATEGYGVVPAWFLAELLACWDTHQPKEAR